MEMSKKTRKQIRFQNITFMVLFLVIIGLLAGLSQRYSFDSDWTATGRNTLSDATVTLLQRMEQPVHITAFARESQLLATRKTISQVMGRYQKYKDDIQLTFINPDTSPDIVRQLGITVDGEMVIEYAGRKEHLQSIHEEAITNTLQRLMRSGEQHVVFIAGHGERHPQGKANHDLGRFVQHLKDKGIKSSTLNLNESPEIPADTAVLVIAGPQADYLKGEVKIIQDYVSNGGNLFWLHDPGKLFGLELLAKQLGVQFINGIVVDPTTQVLGISDPSFALVTRYGNHPVTRNFKFMTVFPQAAAIEHVSNDSNITATAFLNTVERSWSESGILHGVIEYNEGKDKAGPLTIGMALSIKKPGKENTEDKQQRIIVMGDGDFIANAYLGNQGNQDMGYNIINWLSHDDKFISIPVSMANDKELTFDNTSAAIAGLFFLMGLPVILLGAGVYIWLKRRKQ